MTFSELSPLAQEIVAEAIMGKFDGNPPVLPESVRNEIIQWAQTRDE